MMTDQASIFANQATQTPNQNQGDNTPNPDQGKKPEGKASVDVNSLYADQLAAITNDEGKPKYSSVDEAIFALKHSQEHIRQLEQENAQFKQSSLKSTTAEEIMELLNSNKQQNTDDNQNQVDAETIKELVLSTLTQTKQAEIATTNQGVVRDSLVQKFGDKAEEMYIKKASDLGINVEVLNTLSAQSPKAVLEYFNKDKGTSIDTSKNIEGSVNTTNFNVGQKTEDKPNLMYGASRDQIASAWNKVKESITTE